MSFERQLYATWYFFYQTKQAHLEVIPADDRQHSLAEAALLPRVQDRRAAFASHLDLKLRPVLFLLLTAGRVRVGVW